MMRGRAHQLSLSEHDRTQQRSDNASVWRRRRMRRRGEERPPPALPAEEENWYSTDKPT